MRKFISGILVTVATFSAVATVHAGAQVGEASYYALKGRTASGGRVGKFTAAHRSLPLGSRARVTNMRNNRSVEVRINDRGPFKGGRIIDVSPKAAKNLEFKSKGVAPVKVEPIAKR